MCEGNLRLSTFFWHTIKDLFRNFAKANVFCTSEQNDRSLRYKIADDILSILFKNVLIFDDLKKRVRKANNLNMIFVFVEKTRFYQMKVGFIASK